MKVFALLLTSMFTSAAFGAAEVPLVVEGKPVTEIVLAQDATPSVRTAARELQRHLRAMSGAELPIVHAASPGVKNQVYLGESDATRKLGFSPEGLKHDGFKIVAAENHVIVAGPQFYHFFRWVDDNSALIVGIECREPKMKRLVESCKEPDSMRIFGDDMVEIRLETAGGIRPFIGINSAGVVFDECITQRVEDLPAFYRVGQAAVKKYPDRWTVEVRIDAKPLSGARPTPYYPWGVNICRQRKAGNTTEYYMLSPSGTDFKEPTVMGNIFVRN